MHGCNRKKLKTNSHFRLLFTGAKLFQERTN